MASSSKSGHYWTEEETEFMLAKLQECDITKCMDGRKKRNGYLFQRVSSALAEAGYVRTAEQIRVRWKNLKSLYFTIQNRQSGQDRNSCPHFHILDDLLGKGPMAQAAERSVDVLQGTAVSTAAANTDDFTTEMASSRKSGHYWTDEETEFMLAKLQECDIIMCMDGRKTRNGYLFQRVSSALAEAGYDRTAEQIRVRWKNLKSLYFTIQNRQSGQDRKSCPHFHILDDLLGERPTAQAGDEPIVDTPYLSSLKSEDETDATLSHWSVLQPSETNTLNPLSNTDYFTTEDTTFSSKSGHYWTEEETEFMLAKLQECDITKCMDGRKKRNGYLFKRVSSALAEAGYNRTAEQIRVRWKNLKSLYFTIQNRQSGQDRKSCPHFHILDDLLGNHPMAQAGEHTVNVLQGTADDFITEMASSSKSGHFWTEQETELMLAKLQECDITKCMDGRKKRNGYLFQRVSSALAEAGYIRTAEQIRMRWKHLKSLYFTIQRHNRQSGQDRKSCPHFHILNDLLGERLMAQAGEHTVNVLQGTAASTAADTAAGFAEKRGSLKCLKDALPLPSLRLLVSPLQLMAAALWGVVQHRAVMHYGLLEDFITAVLDIIPELLTHSERNQLVLGLRAKIILEMCQSDNLRTRQNIEPHLKRIDELINEEEDETSSSTMKSSLKKFSEVVNTLLEDPYERDILHKKSPPSIFGFNFDSALCSLVKKFMMNLEKGLPVPSLDQTSLWLGLSPPVLKECGDILNRPEPLSKLIKHLYDDDSFSSFSQKRSDKMESKTLQKCKSSATEAEVTDDDLPSVDVAFVYQRQSGSGKTFSCLVCGQGFGSLFELKRHSISGCTAKSVKEKTSSCGWRKENEHLLKESEASSKDNPPNKSGEAESEAPEAVQQTWSSDTSEGQICKRSSRKKTCSVCGEVFTSSTDLTSHMRAHTEDSSQNSGQCCEELSHQENGCNTSRKQLMDVDNRQEMTGGPNECSVILEHIPDDRAISSKERAMFSCEQCGQSFLRENFEKHKQKCSQEYQRKKRPRITSLPNSIVIKACHAGQSASVNKKQKTPAETVSESQLNQKSKESLDGATNKQRAMKCTLCDETFSNLVLMRTHYYDSHKIRESFQCPVCKRVFVRLSDLVKHHQSKLLFQCDTCKRCFVSFFQLNNHRKINNDACDKSFTAAHLKKHKNADKTKERPVCSYCGKNFCNKSALQIHMNRHTGGFSCPICAKVFFQKTALQRHMDRHNGQEPYLCELCGKGWATKAYLKIHMVTHSEERPFTCDQCGMAFKREGPLKDHIISKHTEHRPFKCNVCSKAFKVKCILREHMKRHAGVRPFVCPRCGKSYQKRYELKIHKEKFCL